MRLQIATAADSEYNRVHANYQSFLREREVQAEVALAAMRAAEAKTTSISKELSEELSANRLLKEELNRYKKICVFLKKKLTTTHSELKGLRDRRDERVKYSKK